MSEKPQKVVNTAPAEALEKYLVPTLFGPWAAEVVERVAPQRGESVLDVGCGTGPAARFAADHVRPNGNVIGLDLDAGMLEVARLSSKREGRQVDWRQADVNEMPFDDQSFDVVVCCQGLQFFPDKLAALREMRRVLKSDGRFAASVWRDVSLCPGHLAVSQALAQQSGTTPAPMPPFSLANASEIKSLAHAAGYRKVDIESVRKISSFESASEFVDVLAAGAPSTRKALQSLDKEKKADVISSVTEALREYTGSHGLQLPMESHILMARS